MSATKLAKRVLVTRKIYPEGIKYLTDRIQDVVVYPEDKGMPEDELKAELKNCDGVLCMLSDKLGADVIAAGGDRLKAISTLSVGFDHIDVEECKKRGIAVGNTPGVLTNATADLTLSLLLATARLIPQAAHEAKTGGWGTWKPMWLCGTELAGKTVGVIGLGRIGFAVAKRVKAFDVARILYSGNSDKPYAQEIGAERTSFDDLIAQSDIVIATCALTPATKGLFSADVFNRMKNNAIFINSSRGACVDQDALVDALKTGKIKAAGLDVTSPEPLPTDHPLFAQPNCVILPHIGSATEECRTVMSVMAAQNLVNALTGEDMPARVV